jgi:UV DNA damage endonuclease
VVHCFQIRNISSLDYHHDALFPSSIPPSEIIVRANAIWGRRGIRPKQHLGEARPGAVTLMERRAHADRCETLPPDLPDDMGVLITLLIYRNSYTEQT